MTSEHWNSPSNLKFVCPQKWDDLQITDQEDVRFCSGCQKEVHFCRDSEDFLKHSEKGHCVAFDGTVNCRYGISLIGAIAGMPIAVNVNPLPWWMRFLPMPKKTENS